MNTLTKEYFDQHMGRIDKRFDSVDKRLGSMDDRFDSVEKKIEDEISGLATMVANGFEDIAKRLDVKDRVEKLEKKMTKVETVLNVRL